MQDLIFNPNNIIGDAKDLLFQNLNPMHSAVVVSGGEPTLWKHSLFELLTIIKGLGLKTKVFSNAFDFDVIYTLNNFGLVDEYSFDVKAAHHIGEAIGVPIPDEEYLEHLFASIQNCRDKKVRFELRHTMAPGIDTEAVRTLLQDCEGQNIRVHYQKYVSYKKSTSSNYISRHEDKNTL